MRIMSITNNYAQQRKISCQPLKKNTPSFGMKMSKDGLDYMIKIGAKPTDQPIDESYVFEQNIMYNTLSDIVNAHGRNTEERMKKFAKVVDFYGSSNTLPQSFKTKFIKDQIMGDYGQKLQTFIDLSKKLNDNDRKIFERSMVNLYIKGVSHNSDIDVRDTMIFFNKIKDFMTFEETTYSNYAIKTSLETMY